MYMCVTLNGDGKDELTTFLMSEDDIFNFLIFEDVALTFAHTLIRRRCSVQCSICASRCYSEETVTRSATKGSCTGVLHACMTHVYLTMISAS